MKKLLLGSLISLQLTNNLTDIPMNKVYAKENQENEIYLDDNGKKLIMIGLQINDYKTITFGYLYTEKNYTYLKNARDGRIYNLTNITENYVPINSLYTYAINILSEEQIKSGYITKEEMEEIASTFSIVQKTIKIRPMDEWHDFTYYTFAKDNFDNENLAISNKNYWKKNIDFDENLSRDISPENNYKLGILERIESYPYYTDIYQDEPVGETNQMGIITGYYVLDENNKK